LLLFSQFNVIFSWISLKYQVSRAASSSIIQTYMSTFFRLDSVSSCIHIILYSWCLGFVLICSKYCRRQGIFVTRHPLLVLSVSLLVPILLCIGLIHFKVETRPEKVLNYDLVIATIFVLLLKFHNWHNGGEIKILIRLTTIINILSIWFNTN
jgi:hypothetical protein